MNTPERSAALAKALASQTAGLPGDFAKRVAAIAETRDAARRASWNYVALIGAFVAMLGICVAGWYFFVPQALTVAQWCDPLVRELAAQPWLVIGVVGIAVVQALTFRRRAMI
jgi:hypothetical protein